MLEDDFKKKIIHAIQNQIFLNIKYRNANGVKDEKNIAPYDLFTKKGKNGIIRDFLLGCSVKYLHDMDGFSKYLEDIENITILNSHFSGAEVNRLLKYPKKSPTIKRNW